MDLVIFGLNPLLNLPKFSFSRLVLLLILIDFFFFGIAISIKIRIFIRTKFLELASPDSSRCSKSLDVKLLRPHLTAKIHGMTLFEPQMLNIEYFGRD